MSCMRLMAFKYRCMSQHTPVNHDERQMRPVQCKQDVLLQVKTDFNCNTSLVLDTKPAGSASVGAASSGPVLVLTARPGTQQNSRGKSRVGPHIRTDGGRAPLGATAGQERAAVQLPTGGKLPPVPAAARALQAALPAATLHGSLKELTAAQGPGEAHAAQKVCIPSVRVGIKCPARTPVSHLVLQCICLNKQQSSAAVCPHCVTAT